MSLFKKSEYVVKENGKIFGIWSCNKEQFEYNKKVAEAMGKKRGTNVTIEKK